MNEKEVAELRRRLRPDKSNITHILGCYVNEQKEIISQFNEPLALMSAEDGEPAPSAAVCWICLSAPSRWWTATSTGCS